ncbi:LacI family DNA-binding transcriptional regulator [Xanthomonas massiliensis]|uniref:LacI family DNA-binding transcriptional regulator n=1 Tax=Xanthomonas massiliensis TaxID=1720302 RepID=UPI00082607FC|nr:LacI family DNA-binding transcriptional regulator [Xanthomonas massiliensis]
MSDSPTRRHRRFPRIPEIAEQAGVSPSTVDRVLNERGSVSDALRRRVIEAARRLNVRRTLPDANHGVLHFDVVLPDFDVPHFRRLDRAFVASAQLIGPRISVHRVYWHEGEEAALLEFLRHPPYPRSGLVITARDVDLVRASLRQLQARQVPVVTIGSDISGIGPHAYAGIDNTMVGRTAAGLLGRFVHRPGRVLLSVTSMDYRDHIERVAGFRQVMGERFPELTVELPDQNRNRADLAYEQTRQALARHEDIVAIYSTGSASEGIRRALHERQFERWPVWVGHGATREHAQMMAAGEIVMVIDQDPEAQALAALRHLLHACGEAVPSELDRPTRFRIVTVENMAAEALLE